MNLRFRQVVPLAALVAFVAFAPAAAQDASPGPGLPTAPAADRATEGGVTSGASLKGNSPFPSPLEPYLVTWLLPVSGLLSVLVAVAADRRVRGEGRA